MVLSIQNQPKKWVKHNLVEYSLGTSSTTLVRRLYDARTTLVRRSYDTRTTLLRRSYDARTTVVRRSYNACATLIWHSYNNRTTLIQNFFSPSCTSKTQVLGTQIHHYYRMKRNWNESGKKRFCKRKEDKWKPFHWYTCTIKREKDQIPKVEKLVPH